MDGKDLTLDRFRKLLEDEGYQFSAAAETGNPTGRAWTEFGNVDSTGHQEGSGLAQRIPELIVSLVYRVESLAGRGLAGSEDRHRPRLAAPARRPAEDGPAQIPDGDSLAAMCRGQGVGQRRPAMLLVVLGRKGADRLPAGNRLLHGRRRVQPRRPELAGMLGSATFGSGWCATGRFGEDREREVGRAAMPGQSDGQFEGCKVDLRDKAADPTTSLVEEVKPVGKDGMAALVVKPDLDSREGSANHIWYCSTRLATSSKRHW